MSIIVSGKGRKAQRLQRTTIEQEADLQQYICGNPESLPLHELKDDLQLVVLAREHPTDSGPIDVLAADADGDLYVIETKLYKNQDKRRVIAQVLDYGAALWSAYLADNGTLLRSLEGAAVADSGTNLQASLADRFGLDDEGVQALVDVVDDNLRQGRLRFVVPMDHLDDRLKRVISFINSNSRFTLVGVELDFYRYEDIEIGIPNLYGAEQIEFAAGTTSRRGRRTCDEASFFEHAAQSLSAEELQTVRSFYRWSCSKAKLVRWGTGLTRGSFNPEFHESNLRPFSVRSQGVLTFRFKWLSHSDEGRDLAHRLGEALEVQAGLELPDGFLDSNVDFRIGESGPRLEVLLGVLDEVLTRSTTEPPAN